MNEKRKALELIRECLVDYSTPLYIVGNIDELNLATNNVISVLAPKSSFAIINESYPDWVNRAYENANNMFNIVVFKDFDKLSLEEQNLFTDIICNNRISSEDLPEDLKIILNSEKQCKLIPKISDVVQQIEL